MKSCGLFSFLVFGMLVLGGCDSTDIDPFANDGKYFTVYGFLNEREFDQTLRVIPLSRFPEQIVDPADPQASIDAVVTTTDMTSGNTIRWNHQLTKLSDGSYGHVFKSSFQVRPNRVYRLEITRNDGIVTWAETKVPLLTSTSIEQLPVVIREDATVYQDWKFPGVNSPWDVEIAYWFPGGGSPIRFSQGRTGWATDDGGWMIRVELSTDRDSMGVMTQQAPGGIAWFANGARLRVLDQAWDPPNDEFDPEVLSIPGTLSNVVNGYGFFGSIGLLQDDWPVSQELVDTFQFCLLDTIPGPYRETYCGG